MSVFEKSSEFEQASAFVNVDIVLKDGSKVRIAGIPVNSKYKGKKAALLDLLADADKEVSVKLSVNKQTVGDEYVEYSLEDL